MTRLGEVSGNEELVIGVFRLIGRSSSQCSDNTDPEIFLIFCFKPIIFFTCKSKGLSLSNSMRSIGLA